MVMVSSALSAEERTVQEGCPEGPTLPDSRPAQMGVPRKGMRESLSLKQPLRSVAEALGF